MAKRVRVIGGQPELFGDMHFYIPPAEPAAPAAPPPPLFLVEPAAPTDAPPFEPQAEAGGADWYAPLLDLQSLGSLADRPGSLAGLHAARAETMSQFFTPLPVVKFIYDLLAEELQAERRMRVSIFDNSFGSGRMFAYADPEKHSLHGIEIDAECVDAVRSAVEAADFVCQLESGSMENWRASGFNLGLINPPFSIMLDSPHTEPFECGAFGAYGPKSSHKSHAYALAQALAACRVVAAVMPRTFAASALKADSYFHPRLHSVYHLPRGTFREESTDVQTSLLLFADEEVPTAHKRVFELRDLEVRPEHLPAGEYEIDLGVSWSTSATLNPAHVSRGMKTVKLPHTGDNRVRVCHSGRRLVLKFGCGLAQARVLNRVWSDWVGHRDKRDGRLPKGLRFKGEGWFDLQNYLAQPDPLGELTGFAERIRKMGYDVEVDPGVRGYLRRRARRVRLLRTPLRHTVYRVDGGLRDWLEGRQEVRAVCERSHRVGDSWGRPQVEAGEEVTFTRAPKRGGGHVYTYTHKNHFSNITEGKLLSHYRLADFQGAPEGWHVAKPGLRALFPREWAEAEGRARRLGLHNFCSWDPNAEDPDYQFHDLVEVSMRRGNTIVGWEMGLGKARLAIALCLIGGGKHNLILVEARLIEELREEFGKVGIPAGDWQVIEGLAEARNLRKVNVIAYTKLRSASERPRSGKKYYPIADALRRRVHTVVVDEAHNLKNITADQTQAAARVCPRHVYGLTGTPVDNYPRDILPLMQMAAGDGTAHQPFGHHWPHMDGRNLKDMNKATRGVDVFKEMFVTLEWVTHEFEDGLRTGAKREIPKIKDIAGFRSMVAPLLKRRVLEEPDVRKYVHIPKARRDVSIIEWDLPHLERYVRISDHFVHWYKELQKKPEWERKQINLIAILAKLQGVFDACNFPQKATAEEEPYLPLSSKQRYALNRLEEFTRTGHKTIFFAQSPDVLGLFEKWLGERGIESVLFHGGVAISKRVRDMDQKFRKGSVPVLLASKGCLQTGYNLYQADRAIFYDRAWTPKVEQQAAARMLRPQQKNLVEIEFLELEGSIDMYQRQMCEFKETTNRAGLDYGEDTTNSKDFLHIEAILAKFVEDFEAKYGVKLRDREGKPNA